MRRNTNWFAMQQSRLSSSIHATSSSYHRFPLSRNVHQLPDLHSLISCLWNIPGTSGIHFSLLLQKNSPFGGSSPGRSSVPVMIYLKSFIAGPPTSKIPLPHVGQNSLCSMVPLPLSASCMVGFFESEVYEKDETGTFVVRPKAVPKNFCNVSIIVRESKFLVQGLILCNSYNGTKMCERRRVKRQRCISAHRSSSLLCRPALQMLDWWRRFGCLLVRYDLESATYSKLPLASTA